MVYTLTLEIRRTQIINDPVMEKLNVQYVIIV